MLDLFKNKRKFQKELSKALKKIGNKLKNEFSEGYYMLNFINFNNSGEYLLCFDTDDPDRTDSSFDFKYKGESFIICYKNPYDNKDCLYDFYEKEFKDYVIKTLKRIL